MAKLSSATRPLLHWQAALKFDKLEAHYMLPPGLLGAILMQESGGDPKAASKEGAEGLFGMKPSTAKEMGGDASVPASAAGACARYLAKHFAKHDGDIEAALACYNAGPNKVRKLKKAYGDEWKEHLPTQTKNYIRDVHEHLQLQELRVELAGEKKKDCAHEVLAAHPEVVRDVQQKLQKLGYDVGAATGEFNQSTADSLKQFENTMKRYKIKAAKAEDFAADGLLDMSTLKQLLTTKLDKDNQKTLRAPRSKG